MGHPCLIPRTTQWCHTLLYMATAAVKAVMAPGAGMPFIVQRELTVGATGKLADRLPSGAASLLRLTAWENC